MQTVSIIVPVYNVEEYLAKCLDSLVNQTIKDYKVIVVNDGTKDNSQDIIDCYVQKYPDIIESHIKENGGLSDARNYGLKYADSEYVMFIDSDDYAVNNLVEKCLETIKKEDSDILVYSYLTHHLNDDSYEEYNLDIEGTYSIKDQPEILMKTPNAAWNKIYKKELFKDINYPKGLWYEDLATTPKLLLKAKKVTYIKDHLYIYQADRPNNIMSSVSSKTVDIITVLRNINDYYKEYDVFNKYYEELYYLSLRNLITVSRIVLKSDDRKFVYSFLDKRDKFIKEYFSIKQNKYNVIAQKDDVIYTNKLLSKFYYRYKKH